MFLSKDVSWQMYFLSLSKSIFLFYTKEGLASNHEYTETKVCIEGPLRHSLFQLTCFNLLNTIVINTKSITVQTANIHILTKTKLLSVEQ